MGSRLVPEPDTPRGIIESAEADAAAASALSQQLEGRARNADPEVTQQQLEEAQRRAAWAQIGLDAARARAANREQELRIEAYASVMARYLDAAMSDVSLEVEAHLEQARPHIERALDLIGDRNRAVWALATYIDNPSNYTDPGDQVDAYSPPNFPAASWFSYQGQRFEYLAPSAIIRSLLRPFKVRARALSGGHEDDLLKAI